MAERPAAVGGITLQQEGISSSSVSNIPSDYLKDIKKPHEHDVLCGRGGGTNKHIGNNQWRTLVNANKRQYISLPKKERMLVAQSIVKAVRSLDPPGRFLQRDAKSSTWCDIGDQKAQVKTAQALREGAPDLRISMMEEAEVVETQGFPPDIRGPETALMVTPMAPMVHSMPYSPNSNHAANGLSIQCSPKQQQTHFEAAFMHMHAVMQIADMCQPTTYFAHQHPQLHGQNSFYQNGAPNIQSQKTTANSSNPATKTTSNTPDTNEACQGSTSDDIQLGKPSGGAKTTVAGDHETSKSRSECDDTSPTAPDSIAANEEPIPRLLPYFPTKAEDFSAPPPYDSSAPVPQNAPPYNGCSRDDKMPMPSSFLTPKETPKQPEHKSTSGNSQDQLQNWQKQPQRLQYFSQEFCKARPSFRAHSMYIRSRAKVSGPSGPHVHFLDDQRDVDATFEFDGIMNRRSSIDESYSPSTISIQQYPKPHMTNNSSLIDSDDEDHVNTLANNYDVTVSPIAARKMQNCHPPNQATAPVIPPTSLNRDASATISEISVDDISLLSMTISHSDSREPTGMGRDEGEHAGVFNDSNPTNFERRASLACSEMSSSSGVGPYGPNDVGVLPGPYSSGEEVLFAPSAAKGEEGFFLQQQRKAQHSLQHSMICSTQHSLTAESTNRIPAKKDNNTLNPLHNMPLPTLQQPNQQNQHQQQNQCQRGENGGITPSDREALEMMYLARGESLVFETFGCDSSP